MPNKAVAAVNRQLLDTPFKPAAWLAKIDFINHLVLFNNVLMAVLAEQGAGKSTFIHLLQEKLDESIKACVLEAATPFDQPSLLTQISEAFHLRSDSHTNLPNLIEQINERKAYVLVIIDNAHNLPDAWLTDVLYELKKQGSTGFFHLCLVSDYSLAASLNKLDTETFKNLIHTIEPGSLNENETRTYLLSALTMPSHLHNVMSAKRLRQFYELTNGNIAHINQEMVRFFSAKAEKGTKKSLLARLSLVSVIAFLGFASSYIWQNQQQVKAWLWPQLDKHNLAQQENKEPPVLITRIPSIPPISQIPPFYVAAIHQVVQPPPLKKLFDLSADNEDGIDSNLVVMDKVLVIPKTLNHPLAKPITLTRQQELVRKPLSAQIAIGHPPVVINKLIQQVSNRRIAPVMNGHFTIQLLASRSRTEMQRFINTHAIQSQVKLMQAKRDGLKWYVLTLGDYKQLEEAKAAMEKLPAALTQYKPWVRSLANLGKA